MPFTFSHPAAVLPLLFLPKKWRSATGLIMGSMAPDFEKFIRMSDYDPYSHTWRSLFYFNLPLGLVLCFLFHLVAREALLLHLPAFLRQRLGKFSGFDWVTYVQKNFLLVAVSVLVGATSHLLWDSFTHLGGRGVELFPVLKTELVEGYRGTRVFSLLQKVTSVLGLGALAFYLLRLPPSNLAQTPAKALGRFWGLTALVSVAIVAVRFMLQPGLEFDSLYHLSIILISAGLTSFLISPILFKTTFFIKTR